MKLNVVILVSILTMAVTCQAASTALVDNEPAPALVTGVGGLSCGQFIEHRKQNNPAQMNLYLQWIDGFIVAYNVRSNFGEKWQRNMNGNITTIPNAPTIFLFVEKHCNEHPLDTVMDATFSLIKDLGGEVIWKTYK